MKLSSLSFFKKHSSKAKQILNWAKSQKHEVYKFATEPLMINGSPVEVFEVAKKVDQYYRYSNGAITVQVDGELGVGQSVKLKLGKLFPVKATVFSCGQLVDDYVIAWGVTLPFGLGYTKRYHQMRYMSPSQTKSEIWDEIPGPVGLATNTIFKKKIEKAFKALNEGFKKEVEIPKLRS